jgi:cysteine dioxygenase
LQVASGLFALQAASWCFLGSFDPFGWWDGQAARVFAGPVLEPGLAQCLAPAELAAFQRFWVGLVGTSTAAYFFMQGLLAKFALKPGNAWGWWILLGSISTWFVADSAVSIRSGAWFNVWMVNLPCFVLHAIPLAALRAACLRLGTAPPIPVKLRSFITHLEAAAGHPDLETLRGSLEKLEVTADDVGDFVSFSRSGYQRNLVSRGPWHEVFVICWLSGQRSSIHDHAGSACAFKVLLGSGRETIHHLLPDGRVRPLCQRDLPTGHIVASRETDIHEVANHQPPGQPLITLHIYSPPLRSMRKYVEVTDGHEPGFPSLTNENP